MCHRWFAIQSESQLVLSSLSGNPDLVILLPEHLPVTMFDEVSELKLPPKKATYYRPNSKTFPAIDAFIATPEGDCYGLQYPLNKKHGVKANALEKFVGALPSLCS